MPKITMLFGIILTLLAAICYVASGMASVTALIPAFVGVPLLALGALAAGAREGVRKHIMHVAVLLGLVGFVMPLARLVMKNFAGAALAVWEQGIMSLLCLAFVALCVNSFVQARRSRSAA